MNTNLKIGAAQYTKGGTIGISFYEGGAIALTINSEIGVEAKATVNIPEIELPKDHVILKNWSENRGIPEAMVKSGLVELTGESVDNGFVQAPIAKMKPELLKEVAKAKGIK